jgi:uncharacterized metal-binding protein YceD (DUF177 family)
MSLVVNLRQLDAYDVRLKGTLAVEEMDIDTRDEVIQVAQPLEHDLEVQKLENSILVQGHLHLNLECQCVRCLKRFQYCLELESWTCHLPLQGEDRVAVVNDCVDLTPYVREDILLEFPRHPLCNAECRGLPKTSVGKSKNTSGTGKTEVGSSAWAELNKLKL